MAGTHLVTVRYVAPISAQLTDPIVDGSLRRRSASYRWARLLLVAALFLVGVGAAAYTWQRANIDAEHAETVLADRAAATIGASANTVIAGLGGAAGMVDDDGDVLQSAFDAFRLDVAEVSSLEALAYVPMIPGEERDDFERSTGRQIRDLVGEGLVPSPTRERYAPVKWLGPVDPLTSILIGVDVAGSEISATEAARAVDTSDTVVTRALALGEDFRLFFIIKPLYRPGDEGDTVEERRAAHVGFVASAYAGDDLLADVAELDPQLRVRLSDGDQVLAETDPGPSADAVERSIDVGGRTWRLEVSDASSVDHDLSFFLLGVTFVLTGALLILVLRSAAHDRSMNRVVGLVSSTASLGHQLVSAASVQEVAGVIADDVAPALRATTARLTMLDPAQLAEPAEQPEPAGPSSTVGRVTTYPEQRRAVLAIDGGDGVTAGRIEIEWAKVRFDDTMVATLQTLAELCEQTFQRAAVTDLVAVRSDRLARLAEGLAGATTLEEVAAVITGPGRLPVGAASASLGVIDRSADVLDVFHGDTVVDEVRERFVGLPLDTPLAFTDAARTGLPVLVEDMDSYRERYPETSDATSPLGEGARAAVPMRDGERTIGSVVFAWDTPRLFDDALVSTLSTIAEIATQSVIRASLTEAQAADVQHSRDLAVLAEQLARVATVDALASALVEYAPTPVGAITANIALVEDGPVPVVPLPAFPSRGVDQFGLRALEQDLPGMEAIREGRAVVLGSLETITKRYPGRYAEAVTQLGATATVHLPLLGTDSTPLGAIGFAWRDAPSFSETEMSTLRTIAELSSQTLERVRLGEAEHHVVAGLQDRVTPPLGAPTGLEVADRYLPSSSPVGMGGDWYDGTALDDGRYLVVIGDIAGHGITAVADMIQIRSIINALARGGVPLGEVFPQATGLLVGARELVTASVAMAMVDPAAGTIEYVHAGHPPLLLSRPDGTVEVLDGGRQPLLGLPISHVSPGVVDFEPGAVLVAYTDGLIERRDESFDDSVARLVSIVASVGSAATLAERADAVLDRCLGEAPPEDDVALVLVRRS